MEDIERRILLGIQQLFTLGFVIMFTATLTHVIFLDTPSTQVYLYLVISLVLFIFAFMTYDYIKSEDFITTIQLLTDYGFGEDATLDEVMKGLEEYCIKNGMDVDNVD